jgi:hypothetical protein
MKMSERMLLLARCVAFAFGLLAVFLFVQVAFARTTIESHTDSVGYTHTRINDGKRSTNCVSHTDSVKVTHTRCN